jgi:2-succinyl-6-hydroxy-2,4-cyclohexadiene-1-carboxylate synthase/2-amino-4-hydroxy-6-hydroxymethyldihydropteridine diphosphokinase
VRILALHGFTGAGADFEVLRDACPASWQWHAPDLPGHGTNAATGEDAFSLKSHLREIGCALQDFPGDAHGICDGAARTACGKRGRTHPVAVSTESFSAPRPEKKLLLGYSMGGRLALHFAARHPEAIAALVLIGASPGLATSRDREQRRMEDERLAREIETTPPAVFFEKWWSLPLLAQMRAPALAAVRARRLRESRPHGLAASLRGVGTGALPPLWDVLDTLRLPVLCAAGIEDSKFGAIARDMCARLPNGTFATIAHSRHLPHLEQPAALAAALAAFSAQTPVARQAILAYGSNLGDRAAHLAAAIAALDATPGIRVLATSPFYETEPEDYLAQPRFLNAAGLVSTTLSPEELLAACLSIERRNGRVRTIPNGPRTLDIDLLFYEGATRHTPFLTLPHPRWAQRLFVLRPLNALFSLPILQDSHVWRPLRDAMASLRV